MKKNYGRMLCTLVMSILVMAGCKKELKELGPEIELQSNQVRGNNNSGCRLAGIGGDVISETYSYNSKGLLDVWYLGSYDASFKQEYNSDGRLEKSRLYSNDEVVYTIVFFYDNNRIVKETWYNGETAEKDDEVIHTYNAQGHIQRSESFLLDYYTNYTYTREGNVKDWIFYVGGAPFYSGSLTFLHHHKSPLSAIPGITYAFPYLNGAGYMNKWHAPGDKQFWYDENGTPHPLFEYIADKTVTEVNVNNYVTTYNPFDEITGERFHISFEMENCGNKGSVESAFRPTYRPQDTRRISPMQLLRRSTTKTIKEQVKEWRDKNL